MPGSGNVRRDGAQNGSADCRGAGSYLPLLALLRSVYRDSEPDSAQPTDSAEHYLERRGGSCRSAWILRAQRPLFVTHSATIRNGVQSSGAARLPWYAICGRSPFPICSAARYYPSLVDFASRKKPGVYQLLICRTERPDPLLTTSGTAVLRADGSTVLAADLNSSN